MGESLRKKSAYTYRKLLPIVALAVIAAYALWIALSREGIYMDLAAFFIGFSLLYLYRPGQRTAKLVLSVMTVISAIDYLSWRILVTNWSGWWAAMPLLLAEMFGALHVLGQHITLWPSREAPLEQKDVPALLPVYILIPTVNEPEDVLTATVKGAIAAKERYLERHPNSTVVIAICNDGYVAGNPDWKETDKIARRLGVLCITRREGKGAKAGNIEHARQHLQATGDAYIVIFDADQVAEPDFLVKTIPYFADLTVGWVQTGQYYRNLGNPIARWADDQQALFYKLLCPGKSSVNAAFICGTNVVIRAKALDQIGGLPQESVTEDFAASIALHDRWRSIFLKEVLATGLGPMDTVSYLKQQRRWATGTLGVLIASWRLIFLPQRGKGLSLNQRFHYFLACTHYLSGIRDLVYFVSPILFLVTGIPAVTGSNFNQFLSHFVPYFAISTAAFLYNGWSITGLRGVVIGFGSFPVLVSSFVHVLFRRKASFTVTAKHGKSALPRVYIALYATALLICAVGIGVYVRAGNTAAVLISRLWIIYSASMLAAFFWLIVKDYRYHLAEERTILKQPSQLPLFFAWRSRMLGKLILPPNIAFAFILSASIFTSTIAIANVKPFTLNKEKHPLIGVSLPYDQLAGKPATLQRELGTRLTIIGRTQDINDRFDRAWGDRLAGANKRPWIILEFGRLDANGKPPLTASLTAIANGIQDEALKRWAQDIRSYGKPVYLTVLLHTDRNWAISSAVTNGGIPADVPRAWLHIRSVFDNAGDANIAWVWAPADPAHDSRFAPPVSSVDAILLSLISYPNTHWVDPEAALQAVVSRYPERPIIVEAGANGPSAEKIAWLYKIDKAIGKTPTVHAFIFHEGAPGKAAAPVGESQWSLVSDKQSLPYVRLILSHLMSGDKNPLISQNN